jgi:hypothetical protein
MVLLVIDEAQNLSLGALEELRMLSNLETEKSKLLQIVMVGQPNLREKLNAPELEQLRQRITVSYHLTPLDADETSHYINHRLRRAATSAPLEFPRPATDVIHARSRGVPRIVNVICDAALVFGYAEERRAVDLELVQDVLGELEVTGVLPPMGATNMTERAPSAAAVPAVAAAVPVPPPVTEPRASAPLGQDAGVRNALLDQREQAVRQREHELADQRRILAEEYRLLRARSSAPATAGIAAAPQGVRVQVQPALRTADDRPESFWQRLKRLMLGDTSPAME